MVISVTIIVNLNHTAVDLQQTKDASSLTEDH